MPTFIQNAFSQKHASRRASVKAKHKRNPGKEKYWIQKAIGEKGSLRKEVMRRHGKAGFDAKGRIKSSVLEKMIAKNGYRKQAVLARTLKGLRKTK